MNADTARLLTKTVIDARHAESFEKIKPYIGAILDKVQEEASNGFLNAVISFDSLGLHDLERHEKDALGAYFVKNGYSYLEDCKENYRPPGWYVRISWGSLQSVEPKPTLLTPFTPEQAVWVAAYAASITANDGFRDYSSRADLAVEDFNKRFNSHTP